MTMQINVAVTLKHVNVEITQKYNFALGLKHFICGSSTGRNEVRYFAEGR